ncbi:MAG: hypothetical protein ABS52_16620 [Gemmatimonadetes bacterium SCN 70-22]|nr:MAG: hypothetical protein ABS52_16620 [Gemmatimonadetes bacterium SCN 70-22]
MPEITREEAKQAIAGWIEHHVFARDAFTGHEKFHARYEAILRLALAALEDAERWAPKPRERYVRVADELVAQLRAAPSAPVTLEIRDAPDGTLMLIATTSESGPWREEHAWLTELYELSRLRDAAERRGDRLQAICIRGIWRERLYQLEYRRRAAGLERGAALPSPSSPPSPSPEEV